MSKTKISNKLRAEIINRDNRRCRWCGRSPVEGIKLEVDHIVAESFGGLTTQENLGILCNECNNGKSNDYYGNYLLMTLSEIRDLDDRILFKEFFKGDVFDDTRLRYSLTFFKKGSNDEFVKEIISQDFCVDGTLYSEREDDSAILQVGSIKKENLLLFKDKIKDFLIKNKGYLTDLNGRIIFKEIS